MEIHFTLTPLEVAEGIKPIPPTAKSRAGRFFAGGLIGLAVLISVLAVPAADPLVRELSPVEKLYQIPRAQNLWSAVAPSTAVLMYLMIALRIQRAQQRRLRQDPTEPMQRSALAGLWLLVPLVLFVPIQIRALAIIWHPTPIEQAGVALAPWIAGLYMALILAKFRRRAGKIAVDANPGILRPRTVVITDDGFAVNDGVIDLRTRWSYFLRCRETKNLMVLINEEIRAIIIPKRAIADPVDLIAMKAHLQQHIPYCEFLYTSTGFPVAPMPVVPL